MVRVTNAVATHRKKKRLMKQAKGFVGDRKNHLRLTANAVMSAMASNYRHRKLKKRDFRKLWVARKIRDCCEKTDTSIQELALIAGLPPEQMDRIQSGSVMPTRRALESIALVFSISVEELLPSE
jgi:ribosomal protein L20